VSARHADSVSDFTAIEDNIQSDLAQLANESSEHYEGDDDSYYQEPSDFVDNLSTAGVHTQAHQEAGDFSTSTADQLEKYEASELDAHDYGDHEAKNIDEKAKEAGPDADLYQLHQSNDVDANDLDAEGTEYEETLKPEDDEDSYGDTEEGNGGVFEEPSTNDGLPDDSVDQLAPKDAETAVDAPSNDVQKPSGIVESGAEPGESLFDGMFPSVTSAVRYLTHFLCQAEESAHDNASIGHTNLEEYPADDQGELCHG